MEFCGLPIQSVVTYLPALEVWLYHSSPSVIRLDSNRVRAIIVYQLNLILPLNFCKLLFRADRFNRQNKLPLDVLTQLR